MRLNQNYQQKSCIPDKNISFSSFFHNYGNNECLLKVIFNLNEFHLPFPLHLKLSFSRPRKPVSIRIKTLNVIGKLSLKVYFLPQESVRYTENRIGFNW